MAVKMQIYLVHCGFYDTDLSDGLYESHTNFFVAAQNFEEARAQARDVPEFKAKRMHIDGLQEVRAVSGYRLRLEMDASLDGKSEITNFKHRDLAPKPVDLSANNSPKSSNSAE